MAVYITRQTKEALVTQTPDVRVSQQFVMVLQCPQASLDESANSVMSLTQNVTSTGTATRESVESVMSLTDAATYTGLLSIFGSSTIAMTDVASAVRDLPVSVNNTMTMLSLGGRVREGTIESEMFLVQSAPWFNLVEDRKPVGNTLALVQLAQASGSRHSIHLLGLTQTVNVIAPIKPQPTTVVSLSQWVSTPYHMWVEHDLGLGQFVPTPLTPQHLYHTINFVQGSPIGRVDDPMTLTHEATYGFSITAANTMELTDELSMIAIWVRSVEDEDVVGHALTWYEDTPCGKKQYSPFQGENTIPLDVSLPSNDLQDPQGDTGNFSLYQPYLGVPANEVILRKPEMDNRDRNAFTRVSHETRGGKIIVYADPTWPAVRTLAVTIVGLTETKVDELQSFMQTTVGQEIGLTDWEGRLWKGFIPNPNEPAIQDGRSMWTVSFEFQGEALDVEQPGNEDGNGMAMELSQSVTAVIV